MERFRERIDRFLLDIADPKSIREINDRLSRKTFESLREYYSSKEDLETYTLKQEIERMTYVVVNEKGQLLQNLEDIRQFGRSCRDHEYYRMWRYANQSLLADVVSEIQKIIVHPHDPENELCVRVTNSNTQFSLDFSAGITIAESDFTIGTVQDLTFGTIKGRVVVDFSKSVLEQLVRPIRLNVIFDDALDGVARDLARDSSTSRTVVGKAKESCALDSNDNLFQHLKAPPDFVQLIGQGIKHLDKYVQETVIESRATALDRSSCRNNDSESHYGSNRTTADAFASIVRNGRGKEPVEDENDESWGAWGDDVDVEEAEGDFVVDRRESHAASDDEVHDATGDEACRSVDSSETSGLGTFFSSLGLY